MVKRQFALAGSLKEDFSSVIGTTDTVKPIFYIFSLWVRPLFRFLNPATKNGSPRLNGKRFMTSNISMLALFLFTSSRICGLIFGGSMTALLKNQALIILRIAGVLLSFNKNMRFK